MLRNITYASISENPSTLPRTVRVTLTDGDGATSNSPTKTIDVVAVNDPPVIGAISGPILVPTSGHLAVPLIASDFDGPALTFTAQTEVAGVTLQINGNTLSVSPPVGFFGDLVIEVTASDGIATSSTTFTAYTDFVVGGVVLTGTTVFVYGWPEDDFTLIVPTGEQLEVRAGLTSETTASYFFTAAGVEQIVWRGFNGHDWFQNESAVSALAAGDAGDDVLFGGEAVDALFGDEGLDELHGGAGHDFLDGGPDADTLLGDDGHDVLLGGLGGDFLDGGTGSDRLYGEDSPTAGFNSADQFLPSTGGDTVVGATECGVWRALGSRVHLSILPAQASTPGT